MKPQAIYCITDESIPNLVVIQLIGELEKIWKIKIVLETLPGLRVLTPEIPDSDGRMKMMTGFTHGFLHHAKHFACPCKN
jgi:hypothetical protein